MSTTSMHGMWSSRLAFIFAATGSAVGLGNIWRFPYTAGEYGGGAFVLIYLLCVAAIGIPIMVAEVMLGRRGRQSPINTMRALAARQGAHPAWQLLGWIGILAGFLILSFYSVIAGWTLAYVLRAGSGQFLGIDGPGSEAIFAALKAAPGQLFAWHTLFMVLVVLIVARGVASGLERAVRILMPALFVLLVIMVLYAAQAGDFGAGFAYLFTPDFSALSANPGEAILNAMGQAFFSLSLGMGAIMIYGSYLSSQASIGTNVAIIAGMDTLVAVLAGLAIFPIVFANGLAPSKGPGLIFVTLPVAFGQMPFGALFGAAFFLLLAFAAWTSAISLLEPMVAYLVENKGFGRVRASLLAGGAVWLLGIACLLSLNAWSGFTLFGKGILDLFDYLTANVLLPLGGLLIAIFAGWILDEQVSRSELGASHGAWLYRLWRVLIRWVAPLCVILVFLNKSGLI
ncbi:sodium-dependent transporter [Halochromatium salexigens]|uniref:Transporter n=1 Tax=Halochromatium salexigens TaxID=49447 RepID=A0AAJ0XHI2_HALSE|nr:sodium-dependent transporter [Halochromatium salexigens]MBK5931695.1 sodium-dependent transporter [Halochromatium salexigens]